MDSLVIIAFFNLNMNYRFVTTMYEKDIIIHTVFIAHDADNVTYHDNVCSKTIFLPEIRSFGQKYFHTL